MNRLQEWEQQDGSLPGYVELYRQLTSLQAEAEARVPVVDLGPDLISSRLAEGQPLLSFDHLPVDWSLLRDLLQRVALLLTEYLEDSPGAINKIQEIANSDTLLRQLAAQWYQGVPFTTEGLNHEEQWLLALALAAALKPFLTVQSSALLKAIKQEAWRKDRCPICGGKPDFAFLDKAQAARWLLCSRCDAHWLFQRLECPYCGNTEQTSLAYLTDDKGHYRVYLCDKCHSYLKAIDLRQSSEEVLLPLERILTVDLDRQAQQQGYKAG